MRRVKILPIETNRWLFLGPIFSTETYFIMKELQKVPNKVIFTKSKSPEQNIDVKNKIKEAICPVSEYEAGFVAFDDMFGARHSNRTPEADIFLQGGDLKIEIFVVYLNSVLLSKKN